MVACSIGCLLLQVVASRHIHLGTLRCRSEEASTPSAEASLANRRGRVGCWRCRRWGPRNGRLAGHYRPIIPRLASVSGCPPRQTPSPPPAHGARSRRLGRTRYLAPTATTILPRVAPVAGIGTGLSIVGALTASSHPQPRVINYGTGTPLPLGNVRGEQGRHPKLPFCRHRPVQYVHCVSRVCFQACVFAPLPHGASHRSHLVSSVLRDATESWVSRIRVPVYSDGRRRPSVCEANDSKG